jgi:hypothetical protein
VRLSAAAAVLAFDPDKGKAVLGVIAAGRHGLHSVSAKYTLIGFERGTLNMDW